MSFELKENQENLKEYGFKLPALAPLGAYIYNNIPYQFTTAYDRKVKNQLAELYGQRRAQGFFHIHMTQKISLILVSFIFLCFMGILGEAEGSFYIFSGIIAGLMYFWVDKELEKKVSQRKRQIIVDLPDFINTLALLINAGLQFTQGVDKIVKENNQKGPLYKELTILLTEVKAGKPISQAYEDMAQRCKVPEVTRFVSTIIPNLNRGRSDFVHVLRTLAQEAWAKRKDIAKKQGEEASSKLVIPMVMVFLAVSIIVLAPAVITMG
jgi:tight adherence protein C